MEENTNQNLWIMKNLPFFKKMINSPLRTVLMFFSVLLILLSACEEDSGTSIGDDDYEPNDKQEEAMGLSLDQWITAGVDESDIDWYTFTVNHPSYDVVLIESQNMGEDLELLLEVYDEEGNKIGEQGGGNGANVSINFSCAAGTYYIKISSRYSNNSGQYKLKVANQGINDAFEPNESSDQAHDLGGLPVSDINASLASPYEKDWYLFSTSPLSYDIIKIEALNQSEDLEILVQVYDSERNMIAEQGGGNGANVVMELALQANSYKVKIVSWYEQNKGDYQLNITRLNANDGFEPNESSDQAHDLGGLPVNEVNGSIVAKSENDWYKFTTSNDGIWDKVNISVQNNSDDLELYFDLHDAQHNKIDDLGGGNGANLDHTMATKGGTYLLDLKSRYEQNTGDYVLNIQNQELNDNNEPDDTFEDAREINSYPTGDISGTIVVEAANDNGGDYEFFKVILPANQKVEWSVDPEAANTELHFNVYNHNQGYEDKADGSDGQTITGSVTNSGTSDTHFFIKLGAFPGDNGDYTISFTASAI